MQITVSKRVGVREDGIGLGCMARVDWLVADDEIARRRKAFEEAGGYASPPSQTPWQEVQRSMTGQLETGAVLEPAVKYRRIIDTFGNPRDNH